MTPPDDIKYLTVARNRIKTLRQAMGLTQEQCAAILGVVKASFTRFEVKGDVPNGLTLLKMIALFNVPPDQIFITKVSRRQTKTGSTKRGKKRSA